MSTILDALKKVQSETASREQGDESRTKGEKRAVGREDLLQEEQSYVRLLQALLDIKEEIARQIRPLEEQLVQEAIGHLVQTFSREEKRLEQCLEEIDQHVLGCRSLIEEYNQIRVHLQTLDERISRLGGVPSPPPAFFSALSTTDVEEAIKDRIMNLKSRGKL